MLHVAAGGWLGMYVGFGPYPVSDIDLVVALVAYTFAVCYVLVFVETYALFANDLLVETYAVFVNDLLVGTEPTLWEYDWVRVLLLYYLVHDRDVAK